MKAVRKEIPARLSCGIKRARDLKPSLRGGDRNAFVLVSVGGTDDQETAPVAGTEPTWDDSFYLDPPTPFSSVNLTVWDFRDGGKVFMGLVEIALSDLAHQEVVEDWFQLKKRTKDDTVTGSLRLALKLTYTDAWAPVFKGLSLMSAKQYKEAARWLVSARDAFPDDIRLATALAESLIGAEAFQEALGAAQMVLELQPNESVGHRLTGDVYYGVHDFDEATKAYEKGLLYDPHDEKCKEGLSNIERNALGLRVLRAIAHARQAFDEKQYDIAIRSFGEAISGNPANAAYYAYRSLTYMAMGNDEDAHADALKVAEIDPNWPRLGSLCDGVINKKGDKNALSWKTRWFLLKERFLFYYKDKKQAKPIGVFLLHDFTVKPPGRRKGRFRIDLPNRSVVLSMEDIPQLKQWLDTLSAIASQPISLPLDPKENVIFWDKNTRMAESTSRLGLSRPILHRLGKRMPAKVVKRVVKGVGSLMASVLLDDVKLSGFLYKKGEIRTAFKLRWFALQDNTLYYFPSKQNDLSVEVSPKGCISLAGDCWSYHELEESAAGRPFAFQIEFPTRRFTLSAENGEELREWLQALQEAKDGETTQIQDGSDTEGMKSIRASMMVSSDRLATVVRPAATAAAVTAAPTPAGDEFEFKEIDVPDDVLEDDYTVRPSGDQYGRRNMTHSGSHGISAAESQFYSRFGIPPPLTSPGGSQQLQPRYSDQSHFDDSGHHLALGNAESMNHSRSDNAPLLTGPGSMYYDEPEDEGKCCCVIA